jgi:hypothetical protein
MTNKLQRRALELAYDHGADVHEIATAIEMARTSAICLVVQKTAASMTLRAKELHNG